jgi:hypothetical protein
VPATRGIDRRRKAAERPEVVWSTGPKNSIVERNFSTGIGAPP